MAEPITNVLGIVGMENKGAYDANAYYEKLNVVSYQGSSYCALDSVHNVLPTNTTKWQLIAEKGDKGDTGPIGTSPVRGVDYWNASDIAAIESDLSDDVAEEVRTQIGSLTSATPLVASSTSEMTNTTRVYVNTTDGNWYYYNGSAWVSGGTYQSTGIAEDSVDMSMLTDEVKYNMLTGNLAYYNLVPGYYNHNGVFVQQTENEEVTTGEIYVNNASYVNISADVETTYSFWSGVTFFDEEDNFISRETYVSGAGYENNKMCIKTIPEDTAYCRFSYRMSPGIKYIYFSTNTINNIYRSVVNNNLDGYSVMYEGVAEVVRKELIEGYTNKYNITYKLPYRCDIYDKSNHIANLSYKEFTIPQILEGNNYEIKNNYFLYYDLKTEEIKWRSMDSTAWFNTQSEFKDYVLIGFVNNNYGVISLYGNNFKVERQTNLCSIANGREDGTLPTIENNHFKLAQDTLIFYNNPASGFNQYNHVAFSDGVDVDLSAVDSTLVKIFYIKQLDRVIWVKYSDWNYVDSNGDVYELTVDNSIYIALIRTSQKFMSINSPYIYDGKLFGLDLNNYVDIDVNKNIKSVNHRGYNTVAPENTLPAYKLSKKMGFYYVETDVSFTSDGIPVCIHDQTINRTARNADGTIISGPIAINGITFQEARQYDFGIYKSSDYAGTQIPSLEEFLILCRNLGLQPYIELKNTDTYTEAQIQSLVDLVEKCGMKGKVTWISFTITYLTYVKNYDNKARIGYLNDINSSSIASALELKTNENEVFLDTYVDNATNEKVNLCIQNNIPLEVWTVDDEPTILNMNPYITGVTSDNLIAGEVLYNNNID